MLPAHLLSVLHHPLCMPSSHPPSSPHSIVSLITLLGKESLMYPSCPMANRLAASLAFVSLACGISWSQNRNQIDPTPCFSQLLETTRNLTTNVDFANSWLNLVDEEYYKSHTDEVSGAAEKTLSWKASGDWKSLDDERRKYHSQNSGWSNYNQSVQDVFNGVTDRGLDTIDRCIKNLAIKQSGVFFLVSKNTQGEVQLEIYWQLSGGTNPPPFTIRKSSIGNAERIDTKPSSSTLGKMAQTVGSYISPAMSDPPSPGELFASGVKLGGGSKYTVRLQRQKRAEPVTGSIEGDGFDQVFFSIDPPPYPQPFNPKCTATAGSLKAHSTYYTVPFQGESFSMPCWHMQPGKIVSITVTGTVEPPQFDSFSDKAVVSNSSAGVTYDVVLDMIVRDAGAYEVDRLRVLDSQSKNGDLHLANTPRPVNTSFARVVPPNGAMLLSLTSPRSEKWPGRNDYVSLSDDFTVTVEATEK
jgi:hypothetical protein